MSHVLPPGGPHDQRSSSGRAALASSREHVALVVAFVAALALVIAIWIAPGTYFADTVIAIAISPFGFLGGAWSGVLAGWARAGWLLPDFALRLSLATAVGIASGLIIAWLQLGFEERRLAKVEKSLVSALFSREIWVGQIPSTLMLLLVVGLGGYAATSAIDAMVAADGHQGLSAIHYAILGGGSGGGFDAIFRLPELIFAIAVLLGGVLAFGAVVGFFAGAPAGALYGLLAHLFQWSDLVQGTAQGATASAAGHGVHGSRSRPHLASRVLMSAAIGGVEGALGGAIAAVVLSVLRSCGLV
jgi:hypothetical protein